MNATDYQACKRLRKRGTLATYFKILRFITPQNPKYRQSSSIELTFAARAIRKEDRVLYQQKAKTRVISNIASYRSQLILYFYLHFTCQSNSDHNDMTNQRSSTATSFSSCGKEKVCPKYRRNTNLLLHNFGTGDTPETYYCNFLRLWGKIIDMIWRTDSKARGFSETRGLPIFMCFDLTDEGYLQRTKSIETLKEVE